MDRSLLSISSLPIDSPALKAAKIAGYFVASTAPISVEGDDLPAREPKDQEKIQKCTVPQAKQNLDTIANLLYQKVKQRDESDLNPVELIISVHGFSNSLDATTNRANQIYNYINKDESNLLQQRADSLMYVGYRWPSEPLQAGNWLVKVYSAIRALPLLPLGVFLIGLIAFPISFIPQFRQSLFDRSFFFIPLVIFLISMLAFFFICSLIGLRLMSYFRDYYRATNFGVPDLVEFIRQIDQSLVKQFIKDTTEQEGTEITDEALEERANSYWNHERNRIKLTFIGHSLGAYVVTNVIRIISDVFDLRSIGTLGATDKFPTSDIGRVFRLERLVLVAPDIPINTILSGRANFLRSSIRRFKETYLFSTQGDLALRLASTVANYFSFPTRIRENGYRLGNVAIKDELDYGISFLNKHQHKQQSQLLEYLFVYPFSARSSLANIHNNYLEKEDREEIAKLFTYIDCTDYTDCTTDANSIRRRLLSIGKWRWEPILIYYLRLFIAYSLGMIDTHGGYFQGQFSQQAIYRIAFLGFGNFLDSLNPSDRQSALETLSQECRYKKIRVILSPERYRVDILKHEPNHVRKEMLST